MQRDIDIGRYRYKQIQLGTETHTNTFRDIAAESYKRRAADRAKQKKKKAARLTSEEAWSTRDAVWTCLDVFPPTAKHVQTQKQPIR